MDYGDHKILSFKYSLGSKVTITFAIGEYFTSAKGRYFMCEAHYTFAEGKYFIFNYTSYLP